MIFYQYFFISFHFFCKKERLNTNSKTEFQKGNFNKAENKETLKNKIGTLCVATGLSV